MNLRVCGRAQLCVLGWVWVLGITAPRAGHDAAGLERGGQISFLGGDKSLKGPLRPAHLRGRGGAGLACERWPGSGFAFPKAFPGSGPGISWCSVVVRGSTPQSGFQLGRTRPPFPEVELPGLSGQPRGLQPTFCLFNRELALCWLQPGCSSWQDMHLSPYFTDEDPEAQRGSNLPKATQLPVAGLGWDLGALKESKAVSTP